MTHTAGGISQGARCYDRNLSCELCDKKLKDDICATLPIKRKELDTPHLKAIKQVKARKEIVEKHRKKRDALISKQGSRS